MHYHRSEHWVVVEGTATVTRDDKTFLLQESESTFIPVGTKHRLANEGKLPLKIVEIQVGAYFGEDDIIRFTDDFGRKAEANHDR
jgi:mannose-1-phosphate guanylyltransferase/mannose-6-phosphate isomerase